MATIKEIAKKAGVSIGTVSRVLNYDASLSVTDDTRKKIFEAAEGLAYKKKSAKNAADSKIAIIHWYTEKEELEDLYYMSIRYGIENRCKQLNISCVNYFYNDLKEVENGNFQGVIAIGKFSREQAAELAGISKYIVFADFSPDEDLYDSVIIDFEKASIKIIDYLLEKGHRDIGFISGKESYKDGSSQIEDLREKTYRLYMKEKQLFNEKNIYIGSFSVESGYKLMMQAIEEQGDLLPTAIFAGNDLVAIGCLRALYEKNIPVPSRVNVIGINDISVSKHIFPSLTTLKVYTELMGETALDILMERVAGRTVAKKVFIGTSLIARNSSF